MDDTGPESGRNAGWCETWAFGSVADTWAVPASLARLADTWTGAQGSGSLGADTWTAPGALARLADIWAGAWGSGSVYLEKVPAFFYFAGTFFNAKPIEAH